MKKAKQNTSRILDKAEGLELSHFITGYDYQSNSKDLYFAGSGAADNKAGIESPNGILAIMGTIGLKNKIDNVIKKFSEAGFAEKHNKKNMFKGLVYELTADNRSPIFLIWKIRNSIYLYHTEQYNIKILSAKSYAIKNDIYSYPPLEKNAKNTANTVNELNLFDQTVISAIYMDNADTDINLSDQAGPGLTAKAISFSLQKKLYINLETSSIFVIDSKVVEPDIDKSPKSKKLFSAVAAVAIVAIIALILVYTMGDKEDCPPQAENINAGEAMQNNQESSSLPEAQVVSTDTTATDETAPENAVESAEATPIEHNPEIDGAQKTVPQPEPKAELQQRTPAKPNVENGDEVFVIEDSDPVVTAKAENIMDGIPADARGIVLLELEIGEDGKVSNPKVLRSSNDILNDNAIRTAMQYQYRPAYRESRPIAMKTKLTIKF